jgi:hypothetical protein
MTSAAAPESNMSGNGSPDAPAPVREPREQPPAREFHAQPVEPAPRHEPATIAHFEPTPKPDANTPYVVWTSAPPEKSGGDRGPEE